GVALSRIDGDTAALSPLEVKGSDWLPGTVERVFGSTDATIIAAKEIAGVALGAHPRDVVVAGGRAWEAHRPLRTVSIAPAPSPSATETPSPAADPAADPVATPGGVAGGQPGSGSSAAPLRPRSDPSQAIVVRAGSVAFPDMGRVTDWWRAHLGKGAWPGEDIVAALAARYLGDLVVHAPAATEALRGRPALYLGNHENYLESVIFTVVAPALFGTPTRALAKVEHRDRWLGSLERLLTTFPGREQDPFIVWFDQKDPASLPGLVRGALDRSLLVHVEGTRQVVPGAPVEKISSLWIDVALERGMPIVPVAFRGGLDGVGRHDVPAAAQAHHVGAPLLPETLAAAPYAERRRLVADAINGLGVPAPVAPRVEPVAPGAGIRAALEVLSAGPIRDLLDGRPLPEGPTGAWLAELGRLVG
ncbi:MAG: lysophospholipid acyltransferase family protein, partial [Myxococcota bacterium]